MKYTTTKIVLGVFAVTLILGIVLLVSGFGPFEKGISPKLAKELTLSDEQVEHIKVKVLETQKAKTELQAQVKIAQLDLNHALDKDNVDLDAVMQKIEEIGKFRTELQKATVAHTVHIKNILTPEQREKLQDMRKKIRQQAQKRAQQNTEARQARMERRVQRPRQPMMEGRPGREPPRKEERLQMKRRQMRWFSPEDVERLEFHEREIRERHHDEEPPPPEP